MTTKETNAVIQEVKFSNEGLSLHYLVYNTHLIKYKHLVKSLQSMSEVLQTEVELNQRTLFRGQYCNHMFYHPFSTCYLKM